MVPEREGVHYERGGNQSSSSWSTQRTEFPRSACALNRLIPSRISRSKGSGFACAMQPCSARLISNQIRSQGVQKYSRSISRDTVLQRAT